MKKKNQRQILPKGEAATKTSSLLLLLSLFHCSQYFHTATVQYVVNGDAVCFYNTYTYNYAHYIVVPNLLCVFVLCRRDSNASLSWLFFRTQVGKKIS